MDESYIKLYRKLFKWQWFKDSKVVHVFLTLLLDANYEESKVGFQEVKRGQVITSIKRIEDLTGLSPQEIRTCLTKLEKTGEINKQTTNKYSIITILKYDEYQKCNKQSTNNQQTINNIKEYKEEKEYKENNNKYIVEQLDHVPYKSIVDYMNTRYGTTYKHTTSKTKDLIKARFNEGFTEEDFKTVIDKMGVEWMNTEMQKYLRPETLFGTKFESYLNREVKQENVFSGIEAKLEDLF